MPSGSHLEPKGSMGRLPRPSGAFNEERAQQANMVSNRVMLIGSKNLSRDVHRRKKGNRRELEQIILFLERRVDSGIHVLNSTLDRANVNVAAAHTHLQKFVTDI